MIWKIFVATIKKLFSFITVWRTFAILKKLKMARIKHKGEADNERWNNALEPKLFSSVEEEV